MYRSCTMFCSCEFFIESSTDGDCDFMLGAIDGKGGRGGGEGAMGSTGCIWLSDSVVPLVLNSKRKVYIKCII